MWHHHLSLFVRRLKIVVETFRKLASIILSQLFIILSNMFVGANTHEIEISI